jgi:hypothetical protein
MSKDASAPLAVVTSRILDVREQRELLDMDLAALYGVTVRRLNEQVRRNRERFPDGFILELTKEEAANLKSQFATSSWGGKRKLPLAFTEHGAIMAATVLNSPRAVQMTVYVVRAFVKVRESLAAHTHLARELAALKGRVATLDADTRKQFDQVYEAILGLMSSSAKRQ